MSLVDLGLFCHRNLPEPNSPKDYRDAHIDLQDILRFCVAFLSMRCHGKRVTITSVFRPDGIHATLNAIDFYVEGMDHDPVVRQSLSELKGLVETFAPYGVGGDGKFHFAFVWETDDKHRDHVHLQRNGYDPSA